MKKKILALCLVVVLAITAVTGATLAYFTDTDSADNVFALGNVKIEQKEVDENGNPFEQNQKVYPIINEGDKYNDPNYIWKKVSVKNTGTEACYVRTFIAIPLINNNSTDHKAINNWLHWNGSSATDTGVYAGNGWYWDKDTAMKVDWPGDTDNWNEFDTEIKGKKYKVFVATNFNALDPDGETGCNLRGFFLDSSVNCETVDGKLNYFYDYEGKKFDLGDISELHIPVFTQAIQAAGFVDKNGNDTAADEAFAASGLPSNPWAK